MALTLPLDTGWDVVLNPAGNWVFTDADSSIAQDVASAIRTFVGECWYNVSLGMPYFEAILGKHPPRSLLVDQIQKAALSVPDVSGVQVTFLGLRNRVLTGVVLVTSALNPQPITVTF